MTGESLNELSHEVMSAAYAVHTELGPGLLESAYKACLVYELNKRGISDGGRGRRSAGL
jgi:GxxExxY protein